MFGEEVLNITRPSCMSFKGDLRDPFTDGSGIHVPHERMALALQPRKRHVLDCKVVGRD